MPSVLIETGFLTNKKEKTFKPFIDPDRDPFDEARYIYDNRFEFCNIY